jgi:hypothetical protein
MPTLSATSMIDVFGLTSSAFPSILILIMS